MRRLDILCGMAMGVLFTILGNHIIEKECSTKTAIGLIIVCLLMLGALLWEK